MKQARPLSVKEEGRATFCEPRSNANGREQNETGEQSPTNKGAINFEMRQMQYGDEHLQGAGSPGGLPGNIQMPQQPMPGV